MAETGSSENPTRIGIAVVRHCGKYLIGFRGAETVLAGKAEFPGGKCEPEESSRDCAIRECREETGLSVEPVKQLYAAVHTYSHGTVALDFWLCQPTAPTGQAPLNGFRWIPPEELKKLNFPEANLPLIELLM